MKKGVLWGVGILLGAGLIAYYSSAGSLEEGATGDVSASLVSNTTVSPSLEQPTLAVQDFEVQTTRGETIRLSELVEDKPTLVGFWATWCPNCRRNLPVQNELYQKYKDEVNVVEVNLNERRVAVDRYVNDTMYDFHMAYDEGGVVARAWNVSYTNAHFLIGADGQLLDAFPGDITEAHFQQLANSAKTTPDS